MQSIDSVTKAEIKKQVKLKSKNELVREYIDLSIDLYNALNEVEQLKREVELLKDK